MCAEFHEDPRPNHRDQEHAEGNVLAPGRTSDEPTRRRQEDGVTEKEVHRFVKPGGPAVERLPEPPLARSLRGRTLFLTSTGPSSSRKRSLCWSSASATPRLTLARNAPRRRGHASRDCRGRIRNAARVAARGDEWLLAHARLRPGFHELVETAHERGWRLVVVSSGVYELIEPLLAREGLAGLQVVANRLSDDADGVSCFLTSRSAKCAARHVRGAQSRSWRAPTRSSMSATASPTHVRPRRPTGCSRDGGSNTCWANAAFRTITSTISSTCFEHSTVAAKAMPPTPGAGAMIASRRARPASRPRRGSGGPSRER